MESQAYNVLFLCTGNSARSQMAEALLESLGRGRFRAYSAGSAPAAELQPLAGALIAELRGSTQGMQPKSWEAFAGPDAPVMDIVITVCDNAAGETCPVWPGQPAVAHWGVPDPARAPHDEKGFREAWLVLRRRIELLLALPIDKLDRLAREQQLMRIAQEIP
jgi:arsenate reductase